ncbi:MAG: hypothetical protein J4215_00270 [Candidatus Diapherotrites archaeon]|uniref:Uncharacterized protein n=1 Tax=Candidatus Iainarchaeum sp. TaxID=3101447 RepID=A0A8T4L0Z1_9ARCH|nr:hypothetical protein [Candidatus Diapherotrites archaeon]
MEHPEAQLVQKTFIVKRLGLPPDVKLTRRSLLRWFALSTGLISERESRSTILEVLDALFLILLNEKKNPTTLELQSFIVQKHGKTVSEKLLLYHLKRLIDLQLIIRKRKKYYLNPAPNTDSADLVTSFEYWFAKQVQESIQEISSATQILAENYQNAQPTA